MAKGAVVHKVRQPLLYSQTKKPPDLSPGALFTGDPGHTYPQGWNRTGNFSSRVSMYGNLIHVVIPARIELATYRLGVR